MEVLIAVKETAKEFLERKYGPGKLELACSKQGKEIRKVLEGHDEHHQNLESLISILRQRGIDPVVKARVKTPDYSPYSADDFLRADVVVSFGGDGEVLDVARSISKKKLGCHAPLVWVERADSSSAAGLSVTRNYSYEQKADMLLSKNYSVEEWTRINGVIRSGDYIEADDIALNEIYFGDENSVGLARYTLHHNKRSEFQRSSGGVVSTKTGLRGWLLDINSKSMVRHAWNNMRSFLYANIKRADSESKILEYSIINPKFKHRMIGGSIKPVDRFVVMSNMNYDGFVSFDSSKSHYDNPRCYDFSRGKVLEVSVSDDPLRVMRF